MTFLSGWAIATAAGLTIPPLVALYFLKLRRRIIPISSTFLWKRAVEDLHVNAPFQRLRANLLLLLQLLVLLLAALALGKPVRQAIHRHEDTLILLVDQSASMAIVEEDGRTRLAAAKAEAKRVIEHMGNRARAMVIAFSDRATVVSSFDTDQSALKRKIDSIEQTQSLSRLREAISLAEAYSQNLIIAGPEAGTDIAPTAAAPPATAIVFSDGRIEDLDTLDIQRLDAEKMQMVNVARRSDNVGICSMSARRSYDQPDTLSVFAEVRNFGFEAVEFDANLYVEGQHRDVQTVRLEPGAEAAPPPVADDTADDTDDEPSDGDDSKDRAAPLPGSVASVAFDSFEYGGSGVVEVRLEHRDALAADNKAWAVIDPPRHVKVLLVTAGNMFLTRVLPTLPLQVDAMTPDEYESAELTKLADGERSRYDVVIFDRHSTDRLYQGNYFFWGSIPLLDDVAMDEPVRGGIVYDWDDTHPILRHVPVSNIEVYEWNRLTLPPESKALIEGESTAVLSYFAREGSQYLISAFSILVDDEVGQPMMNTFWVTKPHFPVFMYNAIAYMSSSLNTTARMVTQPGDPIALVRPPSTDTMTIVRPTGERETITPGKARTAHYARTRRVGVYKVEPAIPGQETFAVNLFSPAESDVRPRERLTLGTASVQSTEARQLVNEAIWPYLLLAALGILMLEWFIYNKRVYV